MNIREELEAKELEYLSPYASFSGKSRGRKEKRQNVISGLFTRETGTGSSTANLFGG